MAHEKHQRTSSGLWSLAKRQHGVVSRAQLVALGFSPEAIKHRIKKGRLHPVYRGVYAVGRPEVPRHGRWMAAVLSCGPHAVLSHESAAALWRIRDREGPDVEVSVPMGLVRRRAGIAVHRRAALGEVVTRREGIPVTTPAATLADLAIRLPPRRLEAAINEADKQNAIAVEALPAAVDELPRCPGLAVLRRFLERDTFTLTDSDLERRFIPIAMKAGLPKPLTGRRVNGFKVDFHWPDLGLIVETDGLRYHRTPAQQAKDRLRDQVHTAAGITTLRFTHAQVAFERDHVKQTLKKVAERLRRTA